MTTDRATPSPLHAQPARCDPSQSNRRFRHRSEFTRCRDVLKNLRSWEITYGSSALRQNPFASGGPPGGVDDRNPVQSHTPCPDSTLAALAQLCALRMNARTCLVSLVCDTTESVLVDVNRTTPFQRGYRQALKDPLLFGTCSFPKDHGVSSIAIAEWHKARRARDAAAEHGHHYTQGLSQHWMVVSDARQHDQLQETSLIKLAKWARFYCAVPLRGAQGSVIGSLAILDDEPRYGVSVDQMDLLEDIADTIVEHLDTNIVRASRQVSERLLQGLGMFNAGDSSLREWWASQDDARMLGTGRNVDKGSLVDRQHRVDAEFGAPSQTSVEVPAGLAERCDDSETTIKNLTTITPTTENARPLLLRSAGSGFDITAALQSAFSRASNLLREALNTDGVVLVNANRLSGTSLHRATKPKVSRPTYSRGEVNSREAVTGQISDSSGSENRSDSEAACDLQGFSTRFGSSLNGDKLHNTTFGISVASLRRLIKRYPNGTVVHFDREGSAHVSSDEESPHSDEVEEQHRQGMKRDAQIFGRAVPGAQTLAFYPLWDKGHQRWRSCIFTWSASGSKPFDKNTELLYLNTFSHSIFAELERLESLAADQAKGTFISSISHELRSPLHGILAGVEFLNETDLTVFQQEMARAINSAGKLLLDTVDHILDYSKISTVTRATKSAPSPGESVLLKTDKVGGAETTDLAELTEEIVEHLVATCRSQRNIRLSTPGERQGVEMNLTPYTTVPKPTQLSRGLAVALTISGSKEWTVRMQPGAWVRILTNLVGNAIKYTPEGHISVRLQATPTEADLAANRLPLRLVVEDTGLGMSKSFLDYDLFSPFRQEDPHSSGTGLGLSIVKQIADDLGAVVSVVSERGTGTKFVLTYTAGLVPRSEVDPELPFTIFPPKIEVDMWQLLSISTPTTNGVELRRHASREIVKNSVLENVEDWLHCRIVRDTDVIDNSATGNSLCAVTEADLIALSKQPTDVLVPTLERIISNYSSIVVLADSWHSVSLPRCLADFPLNYIFLHQPIGPRKLLNAITSDRNAILSDRSPGVFSPFTELLIGEMPPATPEHPQWGLSNGHGLNALHHGQRPPLDRRSMVSSSFLGSPITKSSSDGVDSTGMSTADWGSSSEAPTIMSSSPGGYNASRPSLSPPASSLEKTVLLVEDNEINMKFLVALMKKLHVPHRCAADGHEAVKLYRQRNDYCLVLMDMSMPVMDGYTATRNIRDIERKQSLPRVHIAALTGVTSDESKARAFECGVDQFHSKPVKMKEIRALVEKYGC